MKTIPGVWLCAFFCLMLGCSSTPRLEIAPQVRVAFQPVPDPSRELCTDDTHNRTNYVNVPLVRFEGSTMELNGVPSSESKLLNWAREKYKNMAEQTLWVQASPEDRPRAERALLPLIQCLPRLQFRLVDPGFTCRTGLPDNTGKLETKLSVRSAPQRISHE